jgi:hypothetical protein
MILVVCGAWNAPYRAGWCVRSAEHEETEIVLYFSYKQPEDAWTENLARLKWKTGGHPVIAADGETVGN